MIQIPAILWEIASFGGSLYEKGPPPTDVLHMDEVDCIGKCCGLYTIATKE